jgi:hypothetical protein
MPRIRALHAFVGRKKGEEYEATEEHARILCASDLPGGPRCERVEARAMKAQDSSLVDTGSPRSRYSRRDLRARE